MAIVKNRATARSGWQSSRTAQRCAFRMAEVETRHAASLHKDHLPAVAAAADESLSAREPTMMAFWICWKKSGMAPGECGIRIVLERDCAPISFSVSKYCVMGTSAMKSLA